MEIPISGLSSLLQVFLVFRGCKAQQALEAKVSKAQLEQSKEFREHKDLELKELLAFKERRVYKDSTRVLLLE
jgi:hypothetical protein